MHIIVPTNNKGGVGKTKVSILLTEYFALLRNKKVLAIDLDPQCNFSRRFLKMEVDPGAPQGFIPPIHPDYNPDDPEEDPNWDGRSSIADMFYGKPIIPYPTYLETLDIAPAHADQLLSAETQTRHEITEKVHNQLTRFLSADDVISAYDVVIVDTAPSKGPLTTSAIKAASHILIPSIMEAQPIQGIYGMLQLWMQEALIRESTRPLNLLGILPNMYRSNVNLHSDMLNSLREHKTISQYVLPVALGQRVAFAEVDAEGAVPSSIFNLPDSNIAKKEALVMCHTIERRINNEQA